MTDIRPMKSESEAARGRTDESTAEPMFRRYQIKVKAGVRAGAVPTGGPIGF